MHITMRHHCSINHSLFPSTAERQAAEHLLSFFPDLPPHFTIDHYIEQRRIGQDALWPTVQPLPGVLKLVQHLHKHHIPIAVATGSQRRNYEQKSAHLMDALFGLFEGRIVCADDGLIKPGRGKPHPDVFLVAASRMLGRDVGEGEAGERSVSEAQRAERGKGLVFEDAIPGVQAGKRAGMHGSCSDVRYSVDGTLIYCKPSRVGPGREPPGAGRCGADARCRTAGSDAEQSRATRPGKVGSAAVRRGSQVIGPFTLAVVIEEVAAMPQASVLVSRVRVCVAVNSRVTTLNALRRRTMVEMQRSGNMGSSRRSAYWVTYNDIAFVSSIEPNGWCIGEVICMKAFLLPAAGLR